MDQEEKLKFLAESIANAKKVMDKVDANIGNKKPIADANTIQRKQIRENESQRKTRNVMQNINRSKMPKEILDSFMENPIHDATIYNTESLIHEASKHIEPINESKENVYQNNPINNQQIDTRLIEYIIKKTVEETIQQIQKKTNVDENFQIKIGDKIFSGKLSTLTENKKSKN